MEDQPQVDKKGKGKATGKRFEVKKWNAVAMWSWAICTDTCAICRNNLYEPSIEYQANPTGETPGTLCCPASRNLTERPSGTPPLPPPPEQRTLPATRRRLGALCCRITVPRAMH